MWAIAKQTTTAKSDRYVYAIAKVLFYDSMWAIAKQTNYVLT
ncbi:hypothetical protein [Nostoc sp. DedQUE07]|nr:hypothetical protein [Nostoc sp. DedQUE07]MDZ8131278.1 hypothetical protein [Nostoc sp. DedQUE07]